VAAGFGPKPQRFGVGQPNDAMRRPGLPERAHPYSASAKEGPWHLGAGGRATGLRLGKLVGRETMRRCRGHRLENPQSRASATELFGAPEPAAQNNGGPTSPSGRAAKPEFAEPPLYGGGESGMPAHHLSFGREGAARVEALEPFGARVPSPSQRRKTPSGVQNRRLAPALPTFGSAATGHAVPTVIGSGYEAETSLFGDTTTPHGKAPIAPDHGRAHRVPHRDDGPSGPKARQGVHGCQIARRGLRVTDCEIASRELPRNGVRPPTRQRVPLGAPDHGKEPSGSRPRESASAPTKERNPRVLDRGRSFGAPGSDKATTGVRPREDVFGRQTAEGPHGAQKALRTLGFWTPDELHWRMTAERTLGGRIAAGTFGCPPRKGVHGHPTARRNLRVVDRATTSTGVGLRKGTFGLPTKERRFGSRPRDCVSGT
jgi:hypothetical protein